MDQTATFYSAPSYASHGAGFPVYAGSRRQKGGSLLGAVKGMMLPTIANVGKSALKEAVGLAADVASDALSGRLPIRESLKRHGIQRLKNVGKAGIRSVISHINPLSTSGKRKRRASRIPPSKRRRRGLF